MFSVGLALATLAGEKMAMAARAARKTPVSRVLTLCISETPYHYLRWYCSQGVGTRRQLCILRPAQEPPRRFVARTLTGRNRTDVQDLTQSALRRPERAH